MMFKDVIYSNLLHCVQSAGRCLGSRETRVLFTVVCNRTYLPTNLAALISLSTSRSGLQVCECGEVFVSLQLLKVDVSFGGTPV